MSDKNGKPKLAISGWARIYDTEHQGVVRRIGEEPTGWVEIETARGQLFHVPVELAVPIEEPGIEAAAHAILDILREFDPSWGIVDTLNLRRRVARQVMETYSKH